MTKRFHQPEFPTNHPDYLARRHPRINVFSLMPVTDIAAAQAGDEVRMNLASYTDPFAESDIHRLVESHPRWMQGIIVRLDRIAKAQYSYGPVTNGVLPADKLFEGSAVRGDTEIPVRGLIHPRHVGWLAFNRQAFGETHLNSIADLKAKIGKISTSDAREHNITYRRDGTFTLANGENYT